MTRSIPAPVAELAWLLPPGIHSLRFDRSRDAVGDYVALEADDRPPVRVPLAGGQHRAALDGLQGRLKLGQEAAAAAYHALASLATSHPLGAWCLIPSAPTGRVFDGGTAIGGGATLLALAAIAERLPELTAIEVDRVRRPARGGGAESVRHWLRFIREGATVAAVGWGAVPNVLRHYYLGDDDGYGAVNAARLDAWARALAVTPAVMTEALQLVLPCIQLYEPDRLDLAQS